MSGTISVPDQLARMKQELVRQTKAISAALPPGSMTPVRFQHAIVMACQNNPYLLQCNPQSLISAVLRAAHLGLDPDNALGQAYLVPFKGVVQFIAGYRGLVNLAYRSGQLSKVHADVVRVGDDFDYYYGSEDKLHHRPRAPLDAEITHAYATARIVGGTETLFVVMTREEIEKIQKNAPSASARTSPWITHWPEMAKKTALRRLCKILPMSGEKSRQLAHAADLDERAELGLRQHNEELLGEQHSEEDETEAADEGNAAASTPGSADGRSR